jgi:hypothetical protein
MRATVSTSLGIGIFLLAGFSAGWRTGSVRSAATFGLVTAALAATLQIVGDLLLVALWHDPVTLSAIRVSGGLGEVFSIPLMTVLPCVLISAVGGVFGAMMSTPKLVR